MSMKGIEGSEDLKHRDIGIGEKLSILLDSLKEKKERKKSTKTEQQ